MEETIAPLGFVVGILGESSNDTDSVAALLGKRYGTRVHFLSLSPGVTGSQLDNPKFQHIIRTNYRIKKPNLIVVTRDLDAPETARYKRLERLLFFRKINQGMEHRGIFLLNVQAIEALICADIDEFNKQYKCNGCNSKLRGRIFK